jgi:hypothetical protein
MIKGASCNSSRSCRLYRSLRGLNGIQGAVTELHAPWLQDGTRSDV